MIYAKIKNISLVLIVSSLLLPNLAHARRVKDNTIVFESSIDNAKKLLASAFQEGVDRIIVVKDRNPAVKMMAFDWDGVITEERGYYEKAWTVLMVMLEKGEKDADLNSILDNLTTDDLKRGEAFRKRTKGMEHAVRTDMLREMAIEKGVSPELLMSDVECHEKFQKVVFLLAKRDFGNDLNNWAYPNSTAFLEYLRDQNPGVPRYVVTANPQEAFRTLVIPEFEIGGLFDGVFGNPCRSTEGEIRNKTTILKDLMQQHGLDVNEVVFFGDGESDIRFGSVAGVITVGVANNYENGVKLF
ncbi:MAG: haloacid dehalogenase-like hydrolase [Candidatus Omnitrophica bacterium]|nr:haloacid dehalogenase-like hydrolase [Candidatus Omnitrophota bacterium]